MVALGGGAVCYELGAPVPVAAEQDLAGGAQRASLPSSSLLLSSLELSDTKVYEH